MKKQLIITALSLFALCAAAQPVDRGFRHPGGLHTQADFDRIKQQLKDGNPTVTQAWNVLLAAEYSQAGIQTYPVETIVRGGGSGENYINAARGATMAYQNALRWKIAGTDANAKAAVRILNAWAKTNKRVTGDSNYALASGLYGYQFAQAAELMRDYEGWAAADFEAFKRWMLDVWYPPTIGFLRGRNGTWENSSKWWKAPGHYWSNWGLCNALCLISIGVLCDDVFLYNQGISYMKYDQTNTWKATPGETIYGDGLNEFLGYLVTAVADDPRGPYGKLGQMQESGRDQGHATMALGLAVDIAQTLWNQGTDFYHYMDNRLAAGIEWMAAYNNAGIDDLPWHNYHYYNNGYYWTDSRSWLMTGPNAGSRGQTRPYWARVIGHYEGVMGVKMQYSEMALQQMGIDGGGTGSTSGGYDHLGYSVLTCTYDGIAPQEAVPTLLSPVIITPTQTLQQAELGGLTNTYSTNNNTCVAPGTALTLSPRLPDGEADTGQWAWNTGEQTREISIVADRSYIYRATYTNSHGVKSEVAFSIAVAGDCYESTLTGTATLGDVSYPLDSVHVFFNDEVVLAASSRDGFGTYRWDNATYAASRTLQAKGNTTASVVYKNQGAREQRIDFRIIVDSLRQRIYVNDTEYVATKVIAKVGDNVRISPRIGGTTGARYAWTDGTTLPFLRVNPIEESYFTTLNYTSTPLNFTQDYAILVSTDEDFDLPTGTYRIREAATGRYLSNVGGTYLFTDETSADSISQVWNIEQSATSSGLRYKFQSAADDSRISISGRPTTSSGGSFILRAAKGTQLLAVTSSMKRYWEAGSDGTFTAITQSNLLDFPFLFEPVGATAIHGIRTDATASAQRGIYYTLQGLPTLRPAPGIYIKDGRKILIR